MFRVIFGVLAIGILCTVGFAQYSEPVPVGSQQPQPYVGDRVMRPLPPMYMPPQAPIIVQNDSTTLLDLGKSAVAQGKGFSFRFDLTEPNYYPQQNQYYSSQGQQQFIDLNPNRYQQSCTQSPTYGQRMTDANGQTFWFNGYRWVWYNQSRCGL